jgi:crotonobetainyl-CoA:carnitine CoA-transferase CaiB-like acyl-CoA transferase
MPDPTTTLANEIWHALGGDAAALAHLRMDGDGALPSCFAVTDLAAASIGTACLAVAELAQRRSGRFADVVVDRRRASFWFASSLRPLNWKPPAPWDPIAGDYRTRDGWIRLHTNAPHHRTAVERVLGNAADKEAVAAEVARRTARDLECAVVEAGGCAAEMRSIATWADHAQGSAVAAEPLIDATRTHRGPEWAPQIPSGRPLAGIRVLDLTRVLAGPIASRFLAGYGADVLRIDPPTWDEPSIVPEVTLGKCCARLDLHDPRDRSRFEALLAGADVLLHGYRGDALQRLGYGAAVRGALRPGLIDVCLNAYGWCGPWRDRRGFDSLVQMSAGIAEAGMRWRRTERPYPLPVQALDHGTGYLLAAAAVRAIVTRLETGFGTQARLSLARTAKLLIDHGESAAGVPAFAAETAADRAPDIERTAWGNAQRLRPPASIDGASMHWDAPASPLGSAEAVWQS